MTINTKIVKNFNSTHNIVIKIIMDIRKITEIKLTKINKIKETKINNIVIKITMDIHKIIVIHLPTINIINETYNKEIVTKMISKLIIMMINNIKMKLCLNLKQIF